MSGMKTKVKIGAADDRLTMASILLKNGYAVQITKSERDSKKSYDYFVEYEEAKNGS